VGSFIPWTRAYLILNMCLIYSPFVVLSLLTWGYEGHSVFIANSFFMGATVVITLVVRRFNEAYRLSAIRSRIALDDELDRRASIIQEKTEEALRLEEQFRQSQKMEAVGRLAGGVAHDFNNLLMAIQGYAEVLRDSLPSQDGMRKSAEQILKAANRAASLTSQMLAFSRKQILTPVVLDLNSVIDETAKMLKRLIGEDIELRIQPADSLWAVEADPNQIVQVVMNLCVNARDAMPEGGVLAIETGNVTAAGMGSEGCSDASPGEYVKLSISDTGCGISKEMQEHIFEPFFTTKEVGKGTGLGLAMVYGVVKQSGGYVSVDSEPGQGTRFVIYLPRVMQDITTEVTEPVEVQPHGMETILIAEDEEAVRDALSDYMRGLGYTVLTAGSGPQALSVAAAHDGTIDLLISDVVMPKMNGRELSEELTELRPNLRTIFITGYTDDEVLRHGIRKLGTTLLQKPFHLDTLAREVRTVLAEQREFDPSRT
jgi:two-component system cell cycle sensor histidine kinase/response regulator CckA